MRICAVILLLVASAIQVATPSAAQLHTPGGQSIKVETNPEFNDDMIKCKLCDVVVSNLVRRVHHNVTKCVAAAAAVSASKTESGGAGSAEGSEKVMEEVAASDEAQSASSEHSKCTKLRPASKSLIRWVKKTCNVFVVDWFPIIEEQQQDDRMPHEKPSNHRRSDPRKHGGKWDPFEVDESGIDDEEEAIAAQAAVGAAPAAPEDQWPEGMPHPPPEHRLAIVRLCNKLFFPTSKPDEDSQVLATETALFLENYYKGETPVADHHKPSLYTSSILPMQHFKCDSHCGGGPGRKVNRPHTEPPRTRGFSVSMKRLK